MKIKIILFILSFLLIFSCHRDVSNKNRVLNIYNWEEYIGSETIEDFTKQTGIEVISQNYDDEEIMFSTVQSDPSSYDLIVASGDIIREMIQSKLVYNIDLQKIPNIKNIKPQFLNLSFDPDQRYSVPYLWGTTGIVVNRKYIKGNSWKILFNNDYKDKIAMLNNPYEVLSAAFKSIGYSINPRNITELNQASQIITEQKNIIKGYYDAITLQDMIINEDIWAAEIYSGEGITTMDENPNLEYIIPIEGSPIWLDSFFISRDSTNITEAYEFLNYILDPSVIGKISTELMYATPNEKAKEFISDEVYESSSIYPTADILEKCEYYTNIGILNNDVNKFWINLVK